MGPAARARNPGQGGRCHGQTSLPAIDSSLLPDRGGRGSLCCGDCPRCPDRCSDRCPDRCSDRCSDPLLCFRRTRRSCDSRRHVLSASDSMSGPAAMDRSPRQEARGGAGRAEHRIANTNQSRYNHSTAAAATAQPRHSHGTATAQPQHSHRGGPATEHRIASTNQDPMSMGTTQCRLAP